jgi:uncharacterized phage protein (TIGR02218 family)
MTFALQETSRESGSVLELYTFIFGLSTFRFTSFQRDVVWQGLSYTSVTISRSNTGASIEDVAGQVTITLPIDNEVPQLFVRNVPGKVGSVQIFRAHINDPAEEIVVLFDGFVANVSLDGELEAKVLCNPQTKIFDRSAPRIQFMSLCGHILYDERCKVNIALFTFTGLVSALVNNVITVNGAGAVGLADHFTGGFARFPSASTDDARLILTQSGDDMTLLIPFAENVLGQNIDLFAGCDRSLATCDSKFAAVPNYGGFPFVPRKNPFGTRLRGGT